MTREAALIAIGLHYEGLATELRMELIRTAESNPAATRADFIADIARRFTTMSHDAGELQVVTVDASDVLITITDGERPCTECEVGVMTLDDHEWVCAKCGFGEGEGDLRPALQCPHCLAVNIDVREIDSAERWNTAEPEFDGANLILRYGMGDSQFDHDHYECPRCDRRVSLPAHLIEQETWD